MTTRPMKRARISLACSSCRELKTRCDGVRPRCGYCQRKDRESQTPCVYQSQAKARESKEIHDLQRRVQQLQEKVDAQARQHGGPDGGSSGGNTIQSLPNMLSPYQGMAAVDGLPPIDSHMPDTIESIGRPLGAEQSSMYPQSNFGREQRDLQKPNPGSDSNRPKDALGGGLMSHPQFSAPTNRSSTADKGNAEASHFSQQGIFEPPVPPDPSRLGSAKSGVENPLANNEPYFFGDSSNAKLMREVNGIISPSAQTDQTSDSGHFGNKASIYSAPESYAKAEEFRPHPKYLSFRNQTMYWELPRRSLADHLLDTYFSRVHILYPLLHRPTFEAAYEQLWTREGQDASVGNGGRLSHHSDAGLGNAADSGPQSRLFYAGVNAMFALSCQFSDLPISSAMEAAKVYTERAMTLLLDAELLDYPNLSLVQVLLIFCLHLQGTPLRNRLWNFIGIAFRMAQGLGLQVEDGEAQPDGKTKTTLEVEIRRRTWYTGVMIDLTVSMTLGRTAMTSAGFDTTFPQAVRDKSLRTATSFTPSGFEQGTSGLPLVAFFVEALKLSQLTAKINKVLYYNASLRSPVSTSSALSSDQIPEARFDVVMDLERDWTRLWTNLPDGLRWSRDQTKSSTSLRGPNRDPEIRLEWLETQRNVLHARFLYVKLLMYRPSFLSFYKDMISQQMDSPNRPKRRERAVFDRVFDRAEAPTTIQSHFESRLATECFRTAEELITLVHAYHRTKYFSAWWYSIFYSYFTGIIIILTASCPALTENIHTSRIDRSWKMCQEILNQMAIYGDNATRCLTGLRSLHSRITSREVDPAQNLNGLHAMSDSANHDHTTANAFEHKSDSNFGNAGITGGEIAPLEYEILAPLNQPEFEATDIWADALSWDISLDHWWMYDTSNR